MRAGRATRVFVVASLCAGLCAGCAAESQVEAVGADAFVASGRAPSSSAGVLIAQNAALEDARAYCDAQGKRFLPMAGRVSEATFANQVTYMVAFRCRGGAPEPRTPTVDQKPESTIR